MPSLPEAVAKSARRELSKQFRIEQTLGQGGMSIVYLAREIALNRQVAVKVLPLQLSMDPDAGERFKREAQISASLDHPHIVPIYQVGSTSTFVWYSMKWVKGRSLRGMLAAKGRLDLEDCLRVIEPVASALHHAHRRGIVHRDIKPENILIDETGWVMVCDFGIAKAFGNVPLTPTGATIGTPGYMSPEQCYRKTLDGRSDEYALAILTYECLTGGVPFTADSLGEIVRKHCMEPPPRITDVRPDLSASVADALLRALSKQQEERFPDVLEFVQALGGNPTRAIPAFAAANLASDALTVPVSTPKPLLAALRAIPRRWMLAGGAALLFLMLILGLALRPKGQGPDTSSQPAVVSPAPGERGLLSVNSQPWGKVFLDDKALGATPQTQVALAAGQHRLRIVREGFKPYEQILEIAAGQEARLTHIVLKREQPR